MFFDNYLIFIYVTFFIIIYNAAKLIAKNRIVNNVILIGANLIMLLTLFKEHSLIVIAVISLLVFLTGKFLQKRSSKALLSIALVLIISMFSIRNYPYIQDLLSQGWLSFLNEPILSVQKIGLSYILFRYVHWIIESYKKTIHNSDFVTFLNYIFFFPSILAGPIDKYNNFHYWLGNKNVKYHRSLFFAGITRIVIGAFKTIGIVPLFIQYATDYTELIPDFAPLAAVSISLLAYSMYIYLNFSGYCDIAIGTAYLIGIKTPENFNNPYLSINLSEFWKRWHITFTMFLMLSVFKPLIKLYNKLFNPKYRLLVTVLCYLSTFLICGLWHGDSINFVHWGLWHGVGLALNKIWTLNVTPRLPFRETMVYKLMSILATFVFVTFGWVFFNYSSEELAEIFKLIL